MDLEYIDTQSLESISTDIINLNNEYINEINKLFTRLANVPHDTQEWIGESSEKYSRLVLLEKEDFLLLSEDLNKYATLLKNYALEIEDAIQNNLALERNI